MKYLKMIKSQRDYCTVPFCDRITKETEDRIVDLAKIHNIDYGTALDLLVMCGAEKAEIWKKTEKDEA